VRARANAANLSAGGEEKKEVLQWDSSKKIWQISQPEWLQKLPKEQRFSLMRKVKAAWEIEDQDARIKSLAELHEKFIRTFNISIEDASSMIWYVFLELKIRQLSSEK